MLNRIKRIALPNYTPDTPLGIAAMTNMLALGAEGYAPAAGFSPVTSALPGLINGASFVASDGSGTHISGTPDGLYAYDGLAWILAIAAAAETWRFDQFGNRVICVNGGLPIAYSLTDGMAELLGGDPPASTMVATVRQQVFLAGDHAARNVLSISGYNDSAGWTPGVNQCLVTPFPSGGDIMGLCGGETGVILQTRSIKLATYTGEATVWQFDEISKDVGCMAYGSVAQAGALVFFLSDEGFKVCDRSQVYPIGNDQVDRAFFAKYSRDDIVNFISAASDPHDTSIAWAMPGNPGRILKYNYVSKRWSVIETDVASVFQGFTRSWTLEQLDPLFPAGIETVNPNMDASMWNARSPFLFAVNRAGAVGTMTGPPLAAWVELAPAETEPGKRVRFRGARIVGDAVAGTVTLDTRARAGDPFHQVVSGAIRDNGRVPLRANGRHNGVRIDIPAGAAWTYLLGVDLEYCVEGGR